MVKAGVLLDAVGLWQSSQGRRIRVVVRGTAAPSLA
jgi:hypothetical protein